MTKILYPRVGVVRGKDGQPVKDKHGRAIPQRRAIYEVYVPPKLKTAYRYLINAMMAWMAEEDEYRRFELRAIADREATNVYRIAFGSKNA